MDVGSPAQCCRNPVHAHRCSRSASECPASPRMPRQPEICNGWIPMRRILLPVPVFMLIGFDGRHMHHSPRTHACRHAGMPILKHGPVPPTCTAGISCCPAAALSPSEIFLFLAAAAEAIWSSRTEVITSLRTGDASLSFRLCTGNECPPWKRNSRSPCSESASRKALS